MKEGLSFSLPSLSLLPLSPPSLSPFPLSLPSLSSPSPFPLSPLSLLSLSPSLSPFPPYPSLYNISGGDDHHWFH